MKKSVCALLSAFVLVSACLAVDAKPGKQRGDANSTGNGMGNGFPGMGSIEAWRGSRPDFEAGVRSMKARKWDDAVQHFKASLAMYPYQPKAWIEIGRANEERDGAVEEAEKDYREALKLDTSNWHAWKRLANVLLIQKRYNEAREAASSAIELNPPAQARAELDNMIKAIEAGKRNPTGPDQ